MPVNRELDCFCEFSIDQSPGIKEIPAIIRDNISDLEMQELSLIENWHRVNLESLETEKFLWNLWEKGSGEGRYSSYKDMGKKLGLSISTLQNILKAHADRCELGLETAMATPSWKSLHETCGLRDQPEIRKQVLELHQQGKTGGMSGGARVLVNTLRDNKDLLLGALHNDLYYDATS